MHRRLNEGPLPAVQFPIAGEQPVTQRPARHAQGPGFDHFRVAANQQVAHRIRMGEKDPPSKRDHFLVLAHCIAEQREALGQDHQLIMIGVGFNLGHRFVVADWQVFRNRHGTCRGTRDKRKENQKLFSTSLAAR